MRKLFALAGQVRAKGGRGAPYAGPVCLVFVSRASNSMISNLAGASAYSKYVCVGNRVIRAAS